MNNTNITTLRDKYNNNVQLFIEGIGREARSLVWFDEEFWNHIIIQKLLSPKKVLKLFEAQKEEDQFFYILSKEAVESLTDSAVQKFADNHLRIHSLIAMIKNFHFMKRLYDDCLLTKSTVNRMNYLILGSMCSDAMETLIVTKAHDLGECLNFFEIVDRVYSRNEYKNQFDELLLKNSAYKYLCSFKVKESNELLKCLRQHKHNIYKLSSIYNSNLGNLYSADQLKQLISAESSKIKLNL